jgi:hypothetical protein
MDVGPHLNDTFDSQRSHNHTTVTYRYPYHTLLPYQPPSSGSRPFKNVVIFCTIAIMDTHRAFLEVVLGFCLADLELGFCLADILL